MNRVIIRDANLFSAMNEFSKEFVDCVIASLMNLFFEYDQLSLIEKCRDMIAFMISFDLMRMITIFMSAINSMIQFVRVINKIIVDHVFHHALSFVNDIEVKESKITYNNEFILFEIRRYVMKHIQWLNDVLTDIERADCTIFEKKSQFCCERLRVIDFVCDVEKRHSDTTKIIKILNWFFCQNVVDVREFIEICVFYRVFIADFAFIAQLIYAFLKKNVSFVWKIAQQEVMNILKIAFINSSIFIFINYEIDIIILAMNASLKDWKEILMILRDEKKHSMRYESDIWSNAKKKYDVTKKNVVMFSRFWKRFVFIFMTWSLFWRQMLAYSSINWIDLIQIFLMHLLLVDSSEFDFSILKFVTFSISSILLQTICSKSLRRLMILRKSLKKRTLMTE